MVGFITDKDTGKEYAGNHLLIDAYGCKTNLEIDEILSILEQAARATGATILFSHGHPFTPEGSSGAIILAESHVTWHLWPERNNFMAMDIFVCGDCDPYKAIPVIENGFQPTKLVVKREQRGFED